MADGLRVIVNADDLGISTEVNETIFELMDLGRVTSATLLMNGPAIEEALTGLKTHASCTFGVHLNITQFRPLTSSDRLGDLLNEQGELANNRVRTIPLDGPLCDAIYHEWATQIQKALAGGVNISHLDSHHHTHTVPRLFGVLKRLQRDFRIDCVRLSRNLYGSQSPISLKKRLLKRAWNFALRHYIRTRTTWGFTSFMEFYELACSNRALGTTIEAMVHPGHPGYAAETSLLRGPWTETLLRPVRLISYWEM
jgi:predicted glycoside hydrolase/deacetylase ChbG (UPF0249 family)